MRFRVQLVAASCAVGEAGCLARQPERVPELIDWSHSAPAPSAPHDPPRLPPQLSACGRSDAALRARARLRQSVNGMAAHRARRAWVVSDGAAGNENQALALASALAGEVEVLRLAARAPWRWAAPRFLPGAAQAFGPAFAARLRGPLPDLAVGCGRQAALATW